MNPAATVPTDTVTPLPPGGELQAPRRFSHEGEEDPSTEQGQMEDDGEEQATPEEQAMYDLVVSRAVKYMHGPGRDSVLKMMGSAKSPAEGVGQAAVMIVKTIKASIKNQKKELPEGVLFHAATEIITNLMAMGEARGLFQFDSEEDQQKQTEEALMIGLKLYGEEGLQTGELDRGEAQRQMQEGLASEQAQGGPAAAPAGATPAGPPASGMINGAMGGGAA